ncbi:SDR family oxidoreductase [Oceanibacterium hippocampi]|uniref:Glucose 1-dehydrogenase 1 n=1 Tax=Oceanibacterium hippocampi TaxID=745714 RepID=A0A1Y5SSN4_9PROT|nr:SDR family oxidoreductase [Oceanibacterium hippocampi]SLN47115.1 Glucose 1-dehydrogenase 1 [Oceanibacterium hippocampi]
MQKKPCLLVTGGGRGIGAAIVRLAVAKGHDVCFSYLRDEAAAEGLIASLGRDGDRVRCLRGDVVEAGFATRFFDFAEDVFGPVTMLVNNAGVTGPIGAFRDTRVETLRRTVDTNLLGPMMLAQEAVRRWEAAEIPGRMVNVSSIASTLGAPHEYVHYAATKAAIEAMTVGLGKEVAAKGIRVNAVAPGTAFTDIHAAAGEPDRPARVVSRIPMGRIGEPDEIAGAVMWLLSDEASYVTATVLRVSGGL